MKPCSTSSSRRRAALAVASAATSLALFGAVLGLFDAASKPTPGVATSRASPAPRPACPERPETRADCSQPVLEAP